MTAPTMTKRTAKGTKEKKAIADVTETAPASKFIGKKLITKMQRLSDRLATLGATLASESDANASITKRLHFTATSLSASAAMLQEIRDYGTA